MSRTRASTSYRLQGLVVQRAALLEQCRRDLAAAVARAAAARAREEDLRGRVEAHEDLHSSLQRECASLPGATRVDELLRREGYARRLLDEASTLRDELSVAMDERGRCEGDMAARRAAVRAAEAALRVVESHKERWVRERARQRELRDEDDLAVGQRASEPGGELASSRKAAREGRRC